MPSALNEFWKCVDTDTDVLKMDPGSMRAATNIRLITKDGQGFVITAIGGNEQAFALTQGFIPLGDCEYNGVCYIISHSPVTGETEIGTYPSPDPNCTGGFLQVYAPLTNFTGAINPLQVLNAPRLPFRTTLFDCDCNHQIEMFARIDYDNSVNLYIADWKNPFRAINTGFNQDGVCNGRLYWNGSFPNGVDAFGETCNYINTALSSIDASGQLKAGNYFFFTRYTTTDFNPTSFFGESNACQISPNDSSAGITIDGANGQTVTNKSVTLDFSNLDTNYPFIEIAFIYYQNGVYEVGLIDQLYATTPNVSTLQVTITGSEVVIDFTIDDILRRKVANDIPKSIVQLENRAWLANLKSRPTFHPDLLAAAQAIKIGWDDSLGVDDRPFAVGQNPLGVTAEGQYKDYRKTYNETGYFRGETYPFCIRFVFKSGRESDPIPMLGFDSWLDPTFLVSNADGIFRFPNNDQSNFRTDTSTVTGVGVINILGVTFDTSNVITTQWMQDNVCGFYFTRGERNPNLYYQGVTLKTFIGDASKQADCADCGFGCLCIAGCNPTTYVSSNRIPLWNIPGSPVVMFPVLNTCTPAIGSPATYCYGPFYPGAIDNPAAAEADKYGVYSPDHHFLRSFLNGPYFIVPQGQAFMQIDSSGGSNYDPGEKTSEYGMTFIAPVVGNACMYNIQETNTANQNGFTSMYAQGALSDADSFWYSEVACHVGCNVSVQWYNRAFATGRYIALDQSAGCGLGGASNLEPIVNVAGMGEFKIINIYRRDPVTGFIIDNEYDVKTTTYYKISNFIPLANLAATTGVPFYKGDCFVQRTYIKQLYNPNYYSITQTDDTAPPPPKHYTFGVVHGIVTECSINTAMRYQNTVNKYYPETGLLNPSDFIYNDLQFEADMFNAGYNQVLSPSPSAFGFDKNIPFRGTIFLTRIAYTEMYIPGAFNDGYKTMLLASYRDYDYRMGQINKIADLHARLVSVQESGINYHFVNERQAMSTGISDAALLIGDGTVLAQKAQNVTDEVGSQHQWSCVKSDNALYGIDYTRRKIWRLVAEGGVEIISDTRKYRERVYQMFEQGQPQNNAEFTDILHQLADNPVCNEGIVGEYDRKYKEIVWSLIHNQTAQSPKSNYSFAFNEFLNGFVDMRSDPTPFYFRINNNFFTANPAMFPSQSLNPSVLGDVYLEDMPVTSLGVDNRATFYGVLKAVKFSFVVNNNADNTKIFDHYFINANGEIPYRAIYRTMNQQATQFPFLNPNPGFQYVNPTYKENQWRVIIPRTDTIINTVNNIYGLKSPMRGTWMEVNLEYLTNKTIFAKSITSFNRVSSI